MIKKYLNLVPKVQGNPVSRKNIPIVFWGFCCWNLKVSAQTLTAKKTLLKTLPYKRGEISQLRHIFLDDNKIPCVVTIIIVLPI